MADDAQPDNTQPESDRLKDTQQANDRAENDEPHRELMGYEWTEKAYHVLEGSHSDYVQGFGTVQGPTECQKWEYARRRDCP